MNWILYYATCCLILLQYFFGSIYLFSEEAGLENLYLRNIRQLTFSEMGFEKAGEAYFSPDGGTIIFQAIPKGKQDYQIYTMKLDGSLPVMVSTGIGACTCSYFHPEGHKIIFASSHDDPKHLLGKQDSASPVNKTDKYVWELTPYMNIYEANPDGTELRALTFGPSYHAECAYSPDGTKIVYASNESGSMNIYTMNADGAEQRQLTYTENCYNGGPFFSPDGSRIVFRADRSCPDYLQVFVMDTKGHHEEQLTYNSAVNWGPYWHPNGKAIAFATSLHGHHCYEIYLLHYPEGNMYRLTYSPTFDGLPSFNSDGTKILWTSKRGKDNTCQIFLADFVMPPNIE